MGCVVYSIMKKAKTAGNVKRTREKKQPKLFGLKKAIVTVTAFLGILCLILLLIRGMFNSGKTGESLGVATTYYYGVNWSPMFYGNVDIDNNLNLMQAAGVKALRMDVQWALIEPTTKGTYSQSYLSTLDYAVNGSKSRDIKVLMTVDRTPNWANKNQGEFVPPSNDNDYADFLVFLIKRYSGKVNDFEIWNEPNQSQFWVNPNPTRYTALLKTAYLAAKAVNPGVNILGGSISNTTSIGTDFLKGLYSAGAKPYFDVLSQHIYGDPPAHGNMDPETLFDTLTTTILPIMQNNGDSGKKIWITEHGYTTALANSSHPAGVTESVQADYLTRAYSKAKTISQIDSLYYFSWMNGSNWNTGCNCAVTDPYNLEQNYGIVKVDDSQKLAYQSYRNMALQVSNLTPTLTIVPTLGVSPTPSIPTPTVMTTQTPVPSPAKYCCKSSKRGCRKWCNVK